MEFKPTDNTKELYPIPQRYNTIVKANELIQKSRFSLSAQQQKIVLFIISQINPFDDDFKEYEFRITEFCKVCGIDTKGNIYEEIRQQIKDIADKSIWIELDNGAETLARWIETPTIEKNSGTIRININKNMKPFLLHLQEKYTQYDLIYTLNFKSKYSIRLYEYLKSIHFNKFKQYYLTVEIDKFQKMLDSPYKTFRDFNVNVLKPAHKEINTLSDIIFDYELVRNGRRVKEIKLTITIKDTMDRLRIAKENERLLDEKEGIDYAQQRINFDR